MSLVDRLTKIGRVIEIIARRESLCCNRFAFSIQQSHLVGDVVVVEAVASRIVVVEVFLAGVVHRVGHRNDAGTLGAHPGAHVDLRASCLDIRWWEHNQGNVVCRVAFGALEGKREIRSSVFRSSVSSAAAIQPGPRIRLWNLLVVVGRH